MKDGLYHVKADNSDNIDHNFLDAKVKIENNKVTDIQLGHLVPGLPGDLSSVNQVRRILQKGDADVDVVTGSTITARAIVNATNKAIELSEGKMSVDDALNPDVFPQKKPHYIKYATVTDEEFTADEVKANEQTDVIVVGAGASGLSAAITAAQKGKQVLLLEKAGIAGGAMNRSAVIFQAATQKDDDSEKHAQTLIKQGEGNVDQDLVKEITTKAPAVLTALKKLGVNFDQLMTCRPVPYLEQQPARLHVASKAPMVGLGSYLTKILLKRAEALGVKILYDHPVIALIRQSHQNKGICGVVTEYHQQREFFLSQKVILATASADSNRFLAQELSPQQASALSKGATLTPVYNIGDGIRLGMNVGAAITNFGSAMSLPVNRSGSPTGFANPQGVNLQALAGQATMPAINVNIYGQRYVNEDSAWGYISRANFEQEQNSQKPTYLIFGANAVGKPGMLWKDLASLDADVAKGKLVNSPLIKANTVEELSQKTGINQVQLADTLAQWNDFVQEGKDKLFGRKEALIKIEAPYYAWQNLDYSLGSIGGLKINGRCQVLNNEGSVIPGLYAAGMNSGGWLNAYYPSEDAALTGSLVTGCIAGEN